MRILKIILFVCCCFVSFSSTAQDEKEDIKKVIKQFFKGLQKGDTLTLKKTISKDLVLQTSFVNGEGVSVLRTEEKSAFLKSLASKKPEDIWEEKLESYTIQIDGPMANVWTPYKFYLNYKFSHCGVNSFQLFNTGEKWVIIYLIDTRRRLGCNN